MNATAHGQPMPFEEYRRKLLAMRRAEVARGMPRFILKRGLVQFALIALVILAVSAWRHHFGALVHDRTLLVLLGSVLAGSMISASIAYRVTQRSIARLAMNRTSTS